MCEVYEKMSEIAPNEAASWFFLPRNQYGATCVINWQLPCFECGDDVICRNNTLLHCPEHSSSDQGSHSDLHCVCDQGYYADYENAVFDNHDHHDDDEVDHTH